MMTFPSVLILTAARPGVLPQVGENEKPTRSKLFDKIDFDGFHPFIEVFVDSISGIFQSKNSIVFSWFIQNQAQGGPRPTTFYGATEGRNFLLIPEHILDDLSGLF